MSSNPRGIWIHSESIFFRQVWISYAQFELSIDSDDRLQKCRQIYEEANKSLRSCEEKEERLMLLESWRDYEQEFGSSTTMERVKKLLPEKVKRRRKLTAEDGVRKSMALYWMWELNLDLYASIVLAL